MPSLPHSISQRAALLPAQRQPLLALLRRVDSIAAPPAPPLSSLLPPARALSSSATSSTDTTNTPYDVVIVGSGMVGAALAALLRAGGDPRLSALRVALVDRAPPPSACLPDPAELSRAATAPDSRVSTLTPASLAVLERCGAWTGRLRPLCAEFEHMQVWDAMGKGHVRWSVAERASAAASASAHDRQTSSSSSQQYRRPASAPLVMGAVAENHLLQAALLEAALEGPSATGGRSSGDGDDGGCLHVLAPASVEALELPAYSPHERPLEQEAAAAGGDGGGAGDRLAELTLSSGGGGKAPATTTTLRARLVVGADGARSRVRDLAGIRAPEWPAYGQRAVVATVEVDEEEEEGSSNRTAWQVFLPEGPLALLPVRGTRLANVVWSTTPARAAELEAMGAGAAFAAAVDAALGRGGGGGGNNASSAGDRANSTGSIASALTGAATAIGAGLSAATSLASAALAPGRTADGAADASAAAAASSRWRPPPRVTGMPPGAQPPRSFPLSARHAGHYVRPRLALIGDAAHQVHPLAGQGVNLGLGDAEALARAISRAARVGADFGAGSWLRRAYESPRRRANARIMAALDGVQRVFALGGPAGVGGRLAAAAASVAADAAALPREEQQQQRQERLLLPLLGAVRGAGLAALNAFPQLRDAFVLQYAMASGGGAGGGGDGEDGDD
jgi:ubiquinone biosynthesis monooxygenase Coq6